MTLKNILIIQGHPDPSEERFCDAIARAYQDGANAAGHVSTVIRLATLDIPVLRTFEEFYEQSPPDEMSEHIEALKRCDHLVVIYPLWLGGMPSFTRGFFEQLFRPGVAIDTPEGKFPRKLMSGKSARQILTMGMPSMFYRVFYGALSARAFSKSVLRFAGFKPVRRSYFGGLGACSDAKRASYLQAVTNWGSRAH